MNTPFYILSETSLTIFINGAPVAIDNTHVNWEKIKTALKNSDYDALPNLVDTESAVRNYVEGAMTVKHGTVYWNGTAIDSSLTRRIITMLKEGFPVTPLVNFLKNMMANPSNRAQNELYAFLEYGNLPITPDGYFLAYKRVDDNYMDCHSHSIDNSVGQTVEMPRGAVDDRSEVTCSHGLHFCSLEYIKHFWGSHLMVLKINPRDVVSIPVDYNNTKGRCCKYEVISELDLESSYEHTFGTSVFGDIDDFDVEDDDDDEEEYPADDRFDWDDFSEYEGHDESQEKEPATNDPYKYDVYPPGCTGIFAP